MKQKTLIGLLLMVLLPVSTVHAELGRYQEGAIFIFFAVPTIVVCGILIFLDIRYQQLIRTTSMKNAPRIWADVFLALITLATFWAIDQGYKNNLNTSNDQSLVPLVITATLVQLTITLILLIQQIKTKYFLNAVWFMFVLRMIGIVLFLFYGMKFASSV